MAAHFQATEHKFSSPLTGTCLTWHANWACWRHADVMMTSSLSGSGTWVGSSGIRVGSAHPGEEDTWRAWPATPPARAAVSDVRFRRGFQQWLRLFLLYTVVWSKHNFDNFYFWAKSNTPLNHVLWYQLLGLSNRGCTDICSKGG